MMCRIIILLFLIALPIRAAAAEVSEYTLENRAGGGVVLRLQLNKMTDFKTFTLENPDRVVMDIEGAKWRVPKKQTGQDEVGFVKKLRVGRPKPETLRIVMDVLQSVKIEDAFIHVPSRQKDPHFLVVQMAAQTQTARPVAKKEPEAAAPVVSTPPAAQAAFVPTPKLRPERFIIVIDPGHGGVDPGTIGAQATREKEITLRYATHLRDVLSASGRYEVVMTRADDIYVPLRGRVKIAQVAKGQLFISLHADANPQQDVRGLSVYTLSETASDKEAEALAERENKRDIITGVDLSKQSADVAEVLIDLAQRDTNNTSAKFAELVVAELGTEAKLINHTHRFAGFAVLKGVGTPSALVEMGYLSNPTEEAELIRPDYEDKLVHAIARAVDTYCDKFAPKVSQ